MTPSRDIADLLKIMARLRTPGVGCPWDLEQDFSSIAPYTIEEAYEVADAIQRGDLDDLKDELGDLLLQVVFHSRMAEEAGSFGFPDVVHAITAKMIRRHPHVFADLHAADALEVKKRWDEIKAQEKAERAARRVGSGIRDDDPGLLGPGLLGPGLLGPGLLEDVPVALPALSRAVKLQKRAGKVGFDWNDPRAVLAKIREEVDEFEAELVDAPHDAERLEDELGDLLFAVANLARHVSVDPETALQGTNAKFVRRFRHIEAGLAARGRALQDATLEEMETLWTAAKRLEAPG